MQWIVLIEYEDNSYFYGPFQTIEQARVWEGAWTVDKMGRSFQRYTIIQLNEPEIKL